MDAITSKLQSLMLEQQLPPIPLSIEQPLSQRMEIRDFLLSLFNPKQFTIEEPAVHEPVQNFDFEALKREEERIEANVKTLRQDSRRVEEFRKESCLHQIHMQQCGIRLNYDIMYQVERQAARFAMTRILNPLGHSEPTDNNPLFVFIGDQRNVSERILRRALDDFINLMKKHEESVVSFLDKNPFSGFPVFETVEALRVWVEQWEASDAESCPIPLDGSLYFVPTTPMDYKYGVYCTVIKYLWNRKIQEMIEIDKDLEKEKRNPDQWQLEKEREELRRERDDLEKEKEQLQKDRVELEKEKDDLAKEKEKWEKKKKTNGRRR